MAVKKCCIESCSSSTTRSEDIGVTYHKYPKDKAARETWLSVTQQLAINIDKSAYVCSRHFCKSDFKVYQDSKYILKSDAIPSIFSGVPLTSNKMDTENKVTADEIERNTSTSRMESEEENVEAIKKYIENLEREIQNINSNVDPKVKIKTEIKEDEEDGEKKDIFDQSESMVIGTSVMDMILSESDIKIETKKEMKPISKHSLSPKGNSVSLSVGSKVEAKDFADFWYPAEILEVDYDEMEVLVHYENAPNKLDEWISISSPRLRPINKSVPPLSTEMQGASTSQHHHLDIEIEEMKSEDKPRLQFVVGERCLARWRDNRRFIATIVNDLGKGVYEIVFDDGFHWKCNTSRLYKLKKSGSGKFADSLTVDTSMSPTASTPSPIPAATEPNAVVPNTNISVPIFHTHLFDPTRDYLGSKSERREMKRKLNIKEIFNIGQKKRKKLTTSDEKVAKERKSKGNSRIIKVEPMDDVRTEIKTELKTEIPDAVASIIGTVAKEDFEMSEETVVNIVNPDEACEDVEDDVQIKQQEAEVQEGSDKITLDDLVDNKSIVSAEIDIPSDLDIQQTSLSMGSEIEEEAKLENFEKPDDSKNEVIEKMKEVINKLEDGLNKVERTDIVNSPKPEVKIELKPEVTVTETKPLVSEAKAKVDIEKEKSKRKLSKIKKSKKLRLLQEKKVKKQVEKVKSELEEMKRQVEEMRKQMLLKTEELSTPPRLVMPVSFMLPGEWCCKWVNGQPVGTVSEIEAEPKTDANNKTILPRRSVQVEDNRLPEGWSKHMVRRCFGLSAGKWDVVLVSPNNHRFHTKNDMRSFLEQNQDPSLKPYEYALLDFGVHLKLSRRMGWVTNTSDGIAEGSCITSNMSPLAKAKKFHVSRKEERKEKKRRKKQMSAYRRQNYMMPGTSGQDIDFEDTSTGLPLDNSAIEDGYVYVGSLKVQVIENLLRCPDEGCNKNFRNSTLLQMHIKHYHRELREMLGATPKVLDLARKRTKPKFKPTKSNAESKIIKIKITRPPKRVDDSKETNLPELKINIPTTPTMTDLPIPRSQDSPKLRQALVNKPVKRPKVLLPVRRPDPLPEPVFENFEDEKPVLEYDDVTMESSDVMEGLKEPLDFETEISTHTVTKPLDELRRKYEKKRKCFSTISRRPISEDDEWYGINSDLDTRSSFPGSGTPDSKIMDKVSMHPQAVSSESAEDQKDSNMYVYTETGERIKIEHMKREEIINCHCGFREEDGLMVQCELCLCWQHALCHNIQKESEVPEKYTCSICLNPRRGRRSKRFLHDQDRLYEGLLPGAKPCESLRRSHELSGNLLRIQDTLHALRVKYYVATKKDHPKLYLWAKDWENAEVNFTQERLNSDYSDLNIIINNIGKENLPVKHDEVRETHLDMRTPIPEDNEHDRFSHREGSNSLVNLTAVLSSPSGPSLDLPITTSELERLAKSVQEQEIRNVSAPQPEAAIENSACRERLLRHVQRCQALIDARLDSIEAQVAELESQDPSFEDDETADYFPRTKQTVQMLMRDLDTMEELGIIT